MVQKVLRLYFLQVGEGGLINESVDVTDRRVKG
jgi:hypothetical protein